MIRFALSLLVAVALVLAGTSMLRAADDAVTHEGQIVKVDKDQMTIKSGDAQTVVSLTATTKYTLDGKAARLEDLKPGFKIKTTCKKEGTKFVATLADATSS